MMTQANAVRVPYSQQFSPTQTPLRQLLPIIRANQGRREMLEKAIASAFFRGKVTPDKLAKNTLISLKFYGLLDESLRPTAAGRALLDLSRDLPKAHEFLAKHILTNLHGIIILETIREMTSAGEAISLQTLPDELKTRGIDASKNSSDLSNVFQWLREAGLMQPAGYTVNDQRYAEIVGMETAVLGALKELDAAQIGFLRAMLALNVTEPTTYNVIARHAENLYQGHFSYNWKDIPKTILQTLKTKGLIDIIEDKKTSQGARGGNPKWVVPAKKFESEVAEPILAQMFKNAGYREIRQIRAISMAEILAALKDADDNKRARALELLAIRLCQLLDLQFMGWRETDEQLTGGGEVDAMFHAARLIYSRWQVQCKASKSITLETIAKEVGLVQISLANVIVVVSTGKLTASAETYRRRITTTTNLNIVILDGTHLETIVKDPSAIVGILNAQAEDAMRLKPTKGVVTPPVEGGPSTQGADARHNAEQGDTGPRNSTKALPAPSYPTALGNAYCGDSLHILPALIESGVRAKLIMTSPPFALVRKKEYGNEDAEQYVSWFMQFVPLFKQILDPDGSLVIDMGGSWIKGLPVKSSYPFRLLLRIMESSFYLAQDFYHYNPARLPTPAEWVTVRRVRVKDAVNFVWWLTLDPHVPADNRNILRPYSDSMIELLKNGYKAKLRPSGHDISEKFQRNNGGAIPPNLFEFANTESNSTYLRECRKGGIKPHPARFPVALPEFFLKFLTKPGDVVLDPFAGSNVTGEAAERLGRRWISVELDSGYVKGSEFRFMPGEAEKDKPAKQDLFDMPLFSDLQQ